MNSKNVARLFIFVFFLCSVVLCQSHLAYAQDEFKVIWRIPKEIEDLYPAHSNQEVDLEDVKRGLILKLKKLKSEINTYFNGPNLKPPRPQKLKPIGQIFARNRTIFYPPPTSSDPNPRPISGEQAIKQLFQDNSNEQVVWDKDLKIDFVKFEGKVNGQEVNIIAIIKFAVFPNAPGQQDPGGVMTLYHRRICTWF